MARTKPVVFLFLGLALVSMGACSRAQKQTNLMQSADYVDVTASALRLRIYDFAIESVGVIAGAADQIIAVTDDPGIEHNALVWKINAIYEVQLTVFQPDPLAAVADSWTLARQMRQFFEHGAGRDLFGPSQRTAIEASIQLEERAYAIMDFATAGRTAYIDSLVSDWVLEHPLETLSFQRTPISVTFLEEMTQESQTGLAAVESMEESIKDMMNRVTIYGAQLPKQAQWQAELVLNEQLTSGRFSEFFGAVQHIDSDIDDIRDDIRDIRKLADQGVDIIERERLAVFASIDDERAAVMDDLRAEREIVLAAIREERIATMAQLEAMSQKMLGKSPAYVNSAIDHFFWRAAVLLVVLVLIGAVTGVITLRLTRNLGRP